ncbi:MAG: DNA methyltransferase [Pyrinomonadaceae bacterium]
MNTTKLKKCIANVQLEELAFDYASDKIGNSRIVHADCFEWLGRVPENTLHSIVTDPPFGVREYDFSQIEKLANGNGGIWRLPPAFDGHARQRLPRFTEVNRKQRTEITEFFVEWAKVAVHALRPGGHVFIASNAYLSHLVFSALSLGGLEFRGELVRMVRTFRGGDRPKDAEKEFPSVSSLARGCYEPWGILRKPLPKGMKVSECLRMYETGGLQRTTEDKPFTDVLPSGRTPKKEKDIAGHPSLKPQSFLRKIVHAALPLGKGIIADPFMGSGSTIAAAEAIGVSAIGIERFVDYYVKSRVTIPKLMRLYPNDGTKA